MIKLYTKYPKIKKPEDEEDEPDVPEIEIVDELLGFCCIRLEDFILQPQLRVINKKFSVFEYEQETIFQNSELFWPLPNEEEILESSGDKIEAVRAKKYAPKKEENSEVEVNTKAKGRGGKK